MTARCAYFDCYSGAAGDMLLGALLDVGLPLEQLLQALQSLPLSGYRLRAEHVTRQGIAGTRLHVELDGGAASQPHRHLADILVLLQDSRLPSPVIDRAGAVFCRLAEAEAAVHGTTVDQVHFHEVGAVDSIVDVVGCVWGLHALDVAEVHASALPLGEGWVDTAHGRLPVPAPATLKLLAGVGAPIRPSDAQVELVTPTAAALLAEVAVFDRPSLLLEAVGYGFGARELPWPNAVRLWLGHAPGSLGSEFKLQPLVGAALSAPVSGAAFPDQPPPDLEQDTVILLECNLDDITGEMLGYALERLFSAGALDVWFTPIQMKKDRPAVKLSVLAPPERAVDLGRLLLRETTTLGVRWQALARIKAEREQIAVETAWGAVTAKVKRLQGQPVSVSPEYEECAALARRTGVPLAQVYAAVQAAALARLGTIEHA